MDHEPLGGRIPKGERRVRFADTMGLELVSIFLTDLFVLAAKHAINQQHCQKLQPVRPKALPAAPAGPVAPEAPPTEYTCEFTQPVSLISFKERVKLKKVHLENCYINTTAGHVSLTCNIRVLNISYDKSVSVRYTTDDWRTHTDSLASYKPGSCDGWSDQFTSTISIINKLQPGQRIMFAVRYTAGASVHWDNNGGLNYSVKGKCDNNKTTQHHNYY